MQADVCAEFDTKKIFLNLSAKAGIFFCAHLESEFTYKHDFVKSKLDWKPVVNQYPTYTSVMWILEAWRFSVKEGTSCVQYLHLKIFK